MLSFGFEPDGVDIINQLKAHHYQDIEDSTIHLELSPGLKIKVIDARALLQEKRLLNRTGRKVLSDQMDILSLEEWLNFEGKNE